jgi:phosphatidylserine/phosphatidylglycerophosphate/cardiolipin synthase-like enzyme
MASYALVSSGSARGSPWTQTLARGRRSKRASRTRYQTTVTALFGGRASNPGEEGQAVGTKWTPFGAGSLANNPTRTAKATFADSVTVPLPPDEMIAARRRRVATRKNAGSPTSKVPPVRLLTSYDQTVSTIVEEINRTGSGDRVEFSVYVLEPGESTERVLDAMRRAARRGVRVDASLDCSAVSSFTRWCEGTATLASELVEMEKSYPDTVTFTPRKIPTHAKYVMCHRANSVSTAVFGGVNIGDRFKPWRDFAIRAEGSAAVGALSLGVNGSLQTVDSKDTQGSTPKIDTRIGNPYFLRKKPRTVASAVSGAKEMWKGRSLTVGSRYRNAGADAEARRGGVGFFTNRPNGWSVLAWAFPRFARFPGRFDVYPALIDLMDDARWDRYTVAAAYVDRCGVDVLTPALARGAKMTLVMPRNPNVYHDANRKALKRLMDTYGGENGQVRAYMCDDMLHAKVFLAESSTTGESAAMIGSCNLKQRSFGQFAELNALIVQPSCTRQLEKELAKLVSESELVVESDMRFSEPKATIEEWLG